MSATGQESGPGIKVIVGHVCATSPIGLAMVIGDRAGFVLEPQYDSRPSDDAQVSPGIAAPDGTFHETLFMHQGAKLTMRWGKAGKQALVACLTVDKPVELGLMMRKGWADFPSAWWPAAGGIDGALVNGSAGYLPASVRTAPAPVRVEAPQAGQAIVTVRITPAQPLRLVAGTGALPDLNQIDEKLDQAAKRYATSRIAATGQWGGFPQAIADNMNFSRTYSCFDHRQAHIVGRGAWIYGNASNNPDFGPYFAWDSFFNGYLACLEDPAGGRETVRAVLAYQLPEGFVANYARWDLLDGGKWNFCSSDRSQPPVGALCVWKMHERWPDLSFLEEVYPKLVRWNQWWPKARDGNGNGLLEWGSAKGDFKMANLETGWDDTPHFEGVSMSGSHMMADAVDLNALWSMDTFYLAKIAAALGKTDDARSLQKDHEEMNQRINRLLWNEKIGLYCSRSWKDAPDGEPVFLNRITPMNFYPLACDAPDQARAEQVLKVLYRKDQFWGEWLLPTLPYDDPDWKLQNYWRGHVWAPPNWIVWQGLQKYAGAEKRAEFARRSVKLFMKNWDSSRICSENYRSDNGHAACHPHYTWGALLNVIGIEALCGVGGDFSPIPFKENGISEELTLRNIPFGGRRYRIEAKAGEIMVEPERPDEVGKP